MALLVRHLPADSHTAKALGSHGFTMTDLLIMEIGSLGGVNPRHPGLEAAANERTNYLRSRYAHYRAIGAQQALESAANN